MLVLTRKAGERITILDNIEISVLEIKDGCVKIGVKAPSVVPVYRTELLESVRSQNMKAAGIEAGSLDDLKSAVTSLRSSENRAVWVKFPGRAADN